MDILAAEIAKKRKALAENNLVTKERKYFKRQDLHRKEDDEYYSKCKSHSNVNVCENNTEASDLIQSTPEENILLKKFEKEREEKAKGKLMPRRDVIRLLRERNQPIRVFGESDYDTYHRLKRVQLVEPESKGLCNDMIAALDKVDDDEDETVFDEIRNSISANGGSEPHAGLEVIIKRDYISPEDIFILKVKLSSYLAFREGTATDDATAAAVKICELASEHHVDKINEAKCREEVSDYVLRFLKFLLSKWGTTLNQRKKEEKLTYNGKMASATYNQTVNYIKPLFKCLKLKRCQDDILDSLVKITVLLMDRNYIKANDAFLELAIGNAPWPLGVTNHGIHSRTAQEKIHAKNVAHVLNDETQRKYIQAIKRLMTQAQHFFKTDPSKCVNYMGES